MDAVDIGLVLLDLEQGKRNAAITSAAKEYLQILHYITVDIYDSCIADYYAKYTPTVYDRHENISGFNLYKANQMSFDNLYLNLEANSDMLLPYSGKEDVRDYVLSSVMKGLRGVGSRKNPGWPQPWTTSYPNNFSTLGNIWSSSQTTLEGILDDFVANVFDDTFDYFMNLVLSKI